MKSIKALWNAVSTHIASAPRKPPSAIDIPAAQVDGYDPAAPAAAFTADQHYFVVVINEMFLQASRQWFSGIDPAVFVFSEFSHGGQPQVVPFVVGPSMIQKAGTKLPQGMLFRNTRVAGIHPYRGGRLALSVVLCELTVKDYARDLLGLVETVSSALDFATSISAYVKVAGVMLDAFAALMKGGASSPVVGLRREFDDAAGAFSPGYFALINKDGVESKTLWVRNGQLFSGPTLEAAKPYRDADFVLYCLVRPPNNVRTDVSTLPFFPLWERVQSEAMDPRDSSYESAQHNMVTLAQTLLLSPDLAEGQKTALMDDYIDKMRRLHERAVGLGKRAGRAGAETGLDAVRARSMAFLRH